MKKRRYRDFAARSSTNDRETTEGNRRPYSGRVSSPDQTEIPAWRDYYGDGDADRQPLKPSQTHLSGGLRQSESLSMKFQWNNLLAQNPNPGFDPSKVPVLTRPEFDFTHFSNSNRVGYETGYGGRGLGVDESKQYGGFDRGDYTSPLPKSNLGFQENVEDRRPILYRALEEEASFASGTGYSSMALKEGFRGLGDEYDRSRVMSELPIGHDGYARGHTARVNELVDYGGLSVANEGFGGEFNRSSETVLGVCSQGQTVRYKEVLDNEASAEALDDFRGRSREMGHGVYRQGLSARRIEFDNNAASSEALTEGFRSRRSAMAEDPVGHAGYSQGCTPTHNCGSLPVALHEGFFPSDEFNKNRAMAEGPVGHGGYFQGQTTRHSELVDNAGSSEASNEGFRGRSRVRADGPVGYAEYSRGHTPIHNNGSSPIALNEGFRTSDEFTKSGAMVEGPIGHGGYSHGRSRAMAEGSVSHAGYSRGHTPIYNHGNSPIALNEGFPGGDKVNKSREMAEGPVGHGGYSRGQTPRKNELVHPRWAQQSPKEEMSRDHKVPGMKRIDNGDMDALFLIDLLYEKLASVGEDSRSPSHLMPTVMDTVGQRANGSNGSVGESNHENCQLEQHHDYMGPTNMNANHQSPSETSIRLDEFLGCNPRTEVSWNNEIQGFRLGVDVNHERVVEPLSYEGNVQTLALPEEEQGLLEAYGGCQQRLAAAKSLALMTPVRRWALKKKAMREQQSGNHSKSIFSPDLNPCSHVLNSSYEVDIPLTATEDMQQHYDNVDIQQYAATCGEDQWSMEQNVIGGDGQWNNDQGVTCGVDQSDITEGSSGQGVTCGVDRRSIAPGVTSGEDQYNIHQGVISGGDQWNNEQGVTTYGVQCRGMNNGKDQRNNDKGVTTCGEHLWRMNYGEDQWNAEHINNLNSELPASMQEHYSEQSKARIHVKERLGPPKLSTGNIKTHLGTPRLSSGNIKTRLGPPVKSPGSVKIHSGVSPNDPHINILDCKPREQSKSRIRKINPQGDGFIKVNADAVTESIHPQKTALPQFETDSRSEVKTDVTGSIHPHGKTLSNIKKVDFSGSICPQGDSVSKVNVKAAKKEPCEDSKEFKQLIDDAFIKFIKILIENPSQRRQFMEGRGGKCCVCASDKEFVDTATVAKHAFSSPKIGFRAKHLGFHKALCVLLGWDSAAVTNGRWVQQKQADAKALALKEDLVIWPPVVVIHNSSIANKKPEDGRLKVKVEDLEDMLTGTGLVGGKTNVYHGKPADGSVMVVKFKPTFSGLQEAERLHKVFADNKHGKADWQNTSSVGLSNSSSPKQDIEAAEANCLYGYLGNAEDWDLLDLGTKKYFGVKSKTQIKAIANATL